MLLSLSLFFPLTCSLGLFSPTKLVRQLESSTVIQLFCVCLQLLVTKLQKNKIKRVLNNSSCILFIFCQQSTSFFSNTSSPKCEREKGWWDRGRKNSHSQTTRVFSCVPQFPLVICVIWKNCHWLHLFC